MAKRRMDKLDEILIIGSMLPDGPAKVAIFEEAVRHADQSGDVELAYTTRQELLDVAVNSGRGDLLLTHYAWCLAQFDRDPDRYDEFGILWRYKWVTGNAVNFPEIRWEQIEALVDDMERRFQAYGSGARAVADQRYSLARHRGDTVEMKKRYRHFRSVPRDFMSNCAACEADDAVDYHSYLGQSRKAVDVAKPIVQGRMVCSSVPERTYARLLMPLFRLGELDEAMEMYRSGYRLTLRSGDPTASFGRYLLFLAMTDNLPQAIRILQRSYAATISNYDLSSRFVYLRAAIFLLERAERAGLKNRVRVPEDHPLFQKRGVPIPELKANIWSEATAIARRFDERNGTDAFQRSLSELEPLHDQVNPYPLDPA